MLSFKEVSQILREDGRGILATIVSVSGSTPAPAQARMFIQVIGELKPKGTVGGGCIDGDVLRLISNDPTDTRARILTFDLNDVLSDSGLTCGGTVKVLVEPLIQDALPIFEAIAENDKAGLDCILVRTIDSSGRVERTLFGVDGTRLSSEMEAHLSIGLDLNSVDAFHPSLIERTADGERIIEYIEAPPPLIVFGAGHVGRMVAHVAALSGFRVTIVDDRPSFANHDRFPEADQIITAGFLDSFNHFSITLNTYIVIVTRGHRHDREVLSQVLSHDARYVGMIGSKRKVLLTFEELISEGVPRERLESVHAPIGADIGALTAEEIGVSIVAELIAERRKKR